MKKGNQKELTNLFYQPDFKTWSALYTQVTKQPCTTLALIEFLDETKTKIFAAYKGKQVADNDPYFYIPTLIDNAMQQIFEGCWGISNDSVDPGLVGKLKGVYGRVLSEAATIEESSINDTLSSLSRKKGSLPPQKAHFEALQEVALAVLWGRDKGFYHSRFDFVTRKAPDFLPRLSRRIDDFKKITKQVNYTFPWQEIQTIPQTAEETALALLKKEVAPSKRSVARGQQSQQQVKPKYTRAFEEAKTNNKWSSPSDSPYQVLTKLKRGSSIRNGELADLFFYSIQALSPQEKEKFKALFKKNPNFANLLPFQRHQVSEWLDQDADNMTHLVNCFYDKN